MSNDFRTIKRTEHELGRNAETAYLCTHDPAFRESMGNACRMARKNQAKMRSRLRNAERRHKFASSWLVTLKGGDD